MCIYIPYFLNWISEFSLRELTVVFSLVPTLFFPLVWSVAVNTQDVLDIYLNIWGFKRCDSEPGCWKDSSFNGISQKVENLCGEGDEAMVSLWVEHKLSGSCYFVEEILWPAFRKRIERSLQEERQNSGGCGEGPFFSLPC